MSTFSRHRDKVFISYSHRDSDWLKELQIHLKPLEREGIVNRWDDTLIKGGELWRKEIEEALSEARVAILLVSKHFLASEFITKNELPPLLNAAKKEGALILPVILSPCRFSATNTLSSYQALNSPDETLAEMEEAKRDRIWISLTHRIEEELRTAEDEAKKLYRSDIGEVIQPIHREGRRTRIRLESPSKNQAPLMSTVEIWPEETVRDTLTNVWRILRGHAGSSFSPKPYSYHWDWIICRKRDSLPLIMRGFMSAVPAPTIFEDGEIWTVVELDEPAILNPERFGIERGSPEKW